MSWAERYRRWEQIAFVWQGDSEQAAASLRTAEERGLWECHWDLLWSDTVVPCGKIAVPSLPLPSESLHFNGGTVFAFHSRLLWKCTKGARLMLSYRLMGHTLWHGVGFGDEPGRSTAMQLSASAILTGSAHVCCGAGSWLMSLTSWSFPCGCGMLFHVQHLRLALLPAFQSLGTKFVSFLRIAHLNTGFWCFFFLSQWC